MPDKPTTRTATHNDQVAVLSPVDLAKMIADGVYAQINLVRGRLFHPKDAPYPAQNLLEEVIKELQSRV